ncbi:MFS transporter [Actinomadura rubrobrunea]|uniref:MFS transporter n=1 Tax=Actinomadura rubrobrunea TaxID=115335 RepID=A0A9W6Q0A9_9ACTN|nr:MFS transporter [Actinomadura rubrobrunea]GLW66279.1 MFS transporter [Actinomadura rubrobrunea]
MGGVTAGDTRVTGSSRLTLILLCAAQFMLVVDVVVVNVALPTIRADLAIPDGRLPLVAVGYTLTFGSLLIVFGRIGDLFGRRRLFLIGLGAFTLASLAAGLAQTEWQILAARAGQGVGAAMVSPTALALLTTAFGEGDRRNRALGYWGAVGSGGAIAGQLLGGVVTDLFDWRWIFLINVPIGVVALAVARRRLHESRAEDRPVLDVRGAVALTVALAAATLSLTHYAEGGHAVQATWLLGVAIAAFGVLVAVERSHRAPLVDRRLFRVGGVARANALLAIDAGTLGASLFFTTLYMQVVLGHSPLAVGAAFAPITFLILLISPRAGALTTRHGPRPLIATGFALLAAGMLLLARVPTDGTYWRDVLPPLLLLAVGSGLSYAPIFVAGTGGVPDRDQGLASGFLNSAQELGAAVGVAVLGAIATAATSGDGVAALTTGYRAGLLTAAAVTAVSSSLVIGLPRQGANADDH